MSDKQKPSAVSVGVKGIIIGAAATATLMALADDKKRKKLQDTVDMLHKKTETSLHSIKDKAIKTQDIVVSTGQDIKESVGDGVDAAKETIIEEKQKPNVSKTS